jgi:predicted metal-dependent enzyme (double-stranded beta helix superfamily)
MAVITLARPNAARALHPAGSGRASFLDLDAIAAGLATTAAAVPLDAVEPARSYRRVLATAAYDAWIIRWAPSADLEMHDHGGSRGVVHVVEGELFERYTDLAAPVVVTERALPAGTSIEITPTTVHGVANFGPADALSVHVYSPPLSTMTYYESSRTEVISGTSS